MVLYGPWQNKTVIRFVIELTQKYVGVDKAYRRLGASASPSMGFINPTYFCVRSITNLITNNVQAFFDYVNVKCSTIFKITLF